VFGRARQTFANQEERLQGGNCKCDGNEYAPDIALNLRRSATTFTRRTIQESSAIGFIAAASRKDARSVSDIGARLTLPSRLFSGWLSFSGLNEDRYRHFLGQGMNAFRSLRQSDSPREVLEARVSSQAIEHRIIREAHPYPQPLLLMCLIEPLESSILLAETCIDHCYEIWRDINLLCPLHQLVEHLLCVAPSTRRSIDVS
jgi:hypothetical protein